jgi:Tn3 transposase DDE domain
MRPACSASTRQQYRGYSREPETDQLGALGLIVSAVVLWNTIYMDAALKQLRKEGFPVLDEDVARLSPLATNTSICSGGMLSRSRTTSRAANCGRSETPTRQMMRAESEFLFRCYSDP